MLGAGNLESKPQLLYLDTTQFWDTFYVFATLYSIRASRLCIVDPYVLAWQRFASSSLHRYVSSYNVRKEAYCDSHQLLKKFNKSASALNGFWNLKRQCTEQISATSGPPFSEPKPVRSVPAKLFENSLLFSRVEKPRSVSPHVHPGACTLGPKPLVNRRPSLESNAHTRNRGNPHSQCGLKLRRTMFPFHGTQHEGTNKQKVPEWLACCTHYWFYHALEPFAIFDHSIIQCSKQFSFWRHPLRDAPAVQAPDKETGIALCQPKAHLNRKIPYHWVVGIASLIVKPKTRDTPMWLAVWASLARTQYQQHSIHTKLSRECSHNLHFRTDKYDRRPSEGLHAVPLELGNSRDHAKLWWEIADCPDRMHLPS